VLADAAKEIIDRQAGRSNGGVVFLNRSGGPYNRITYGQRFRRLSIKAGTSKIYTPYSLRHTFASMQSDGGVETTALASLMGHSTTRTLIRYVNNTFEHHLNAVQQLEDRVNKIRGG
jgi:integrase